jgi:hypothetical protein
MQPHDSVAKTIRSSERILPRNAGPALASSLSVHHWGDMVMQSLFGFTTLPAVLIGALGGCSAPAYSSDEPANDVQDTYDAATTNTAYFEISSDLRRCASPTCGGWFVSRLNRSTTTCVDGRTAASCYTPVLDWSATGLTDAQQAPFLDACRRAAASGGTYAIVRGEFARSNTTPRPELGRFLVLEAWVAEGDPVTDGTFVRTQDNGMRCFAAPCPSITEQTLNMTTTANIAAMDWTPSGLDADQVAECTQDLMTPSGLLIAGYRYNYTVNGTAAKGRTVTAAFQRILLAP